MTLKPALYRQPLLGQHCGADKAFCVAWLALVREACRWMWWRASRPG